MSRPAFLTSAPLAAVLLATSLIGASCSSAAEVTDADRSGGVTTPTTGTTLASGPTPTTESVRPDVSDPALEIPDDLGYLDVDRGNDEDGANNGAASGSSSPISGKGKGPQTEEPASPSGDPLAAGYKGPVGGWSLTEVLSETNIPFPTAAAGTAPLTGLQGSVTNRPAVVVKIDNSSKARPQAGVALADIVVEEEVEGGITRLAAIFHSNDSVVGPVRSGRTTDASFINSLGEPALVYSGANRIIDDVLLSFDQIQNFSAARNGGYWRDTSRRAPADLFAETSSYNNTGNSPPAWFHYRDVGVASAGTPTTSVTVRFGNSRADWSWDGSGWLRTQNGSAHVADTGERVTAANIVVAEVPSFDTGLRDSGGGVIPEFVWAGAGAVTVFTDGKRIDGQWVRPRLIDPAVLQAADGSIIELTPGVTWVELVEPNRLSSS